MKQLFFTILLCGGLFYLQAQTDALQITTPVEKGDFFSGFTRKIPYSRMIPPYGLEVCQNKTTHILFPSPIRYVDLGNENLIAAKAEEAENVLRIKSAESFFVDETNLSVITENGNFYTFNVRYALEPEKLNIEMWDFLHDGQVVNRPHNAIEVLLTDLGKESPSLVRLILKGIQQNNQRLIKHIGSKNFKIQYLLKGIYAYKGLLYFHTEIQNSSSVDFQIDYISFKIVDRKLIRRTTIQENLLQPLRAENYITSVSAKQTESSVMAFPSFTIPNDKILQVDLHEKNGGRHQSFLIENNDLINAKEISEFTIR